MVINPPPLAVTVIVAIPGVADALATMVNTLDPDPGAGRLAGARVAVTPAGAPVTASVTALEKPPAVAIDTVDVPLAPCGSVNAAADIVTLIDGEPVVIAASLQ